MPRGKRRKYSKWDDDEDEPGNPPTHIMRMGHRDTGLWKDVGVAWSNFTRKRKDPYFSCKLDLGTVLDWSKFQSGRYVLHIYKNDKVYENHKK